MNNEQAFGGGRENPYKDWSLIDLVITYETEMAKRALGAHPEETRPQDIYTDEKKTTQRDMWKEKKEMLGDIKTELERRDVVFNNKGEIDLGKSSKEVQRKIEIQRKINEHKV
jgi:hypothetical protein